MSHFEQLLPVVKMISNMNHIRCKTEIQVIEHIKCSCTFLFFMMKKCLKMTKIGQNMLNE